MPFKDLLEAVHDTAHWVLHVALIPVLAVLRAVDSCVQHLIKELGKV